MAMGDRFNLHQTVWCQRSRVAEGARVKVLPLGVVRSAKGSMGNEPATAGASRTPRVAKKTASEDGAGGGAFASAPRETSGWNAAAGGKSAEIRLGGNRGGTLPVRVGYWIQSEATK